MAVWRKSIAITLLSLLAVILALNFVFYPPLSALSQNSSIVADNDGRWLSGFTVEDGTWRIAADIDYIDSRFIDRLIAIEDKRFYNHSGVDMIAIARAMRTWKRNGKPLSGASTLTMQLVRQLEPRPRTLRSKAIESLRAIQLEMWLSKREILEAYLTHVPYGGNIEGIEAASRAYFSKEADQLTDGEIALLIALPQAPEARRPDLRAEGARIGRDIILEKLGEKGLISNLAISEAKEEVITGREALPDIAWLTAYGLTHSHDKRRSTLDIDFQKELEALAIDKLSAENISTNMSAIVIENQTMAVRAHIGSGDRHRPGGWIDMSKRQRSPGSTLKPLIYALAIDDGLVSSGTKLEDRPTRYGSYRPENFNRRYHGRVSIDEALTHSLNIPAVSVLDRLGPNRLMSVLETAGVNISKNNADDKDAGLAIALGGTGMTLNDIAMIYAGIANEGKVRPLRWDDESRTHKGYAVMSPKAAHSITKSLTQSPTPRGHVPHWLSQENAPIAYKTGTSYGFRDAWAAGFTKEWTVVVWVGRPDGAPRLGQTGRKAAAPMLFDIFSFLPHQASQSKFEKRDEAPTGLSRFNDKDGPQILFPPDGADIYSPDFGLKSRGFTLSVQSDQALTYYINGKRLSSNHWKPETEGFYTVSVRNESGQEAMSKVRIIGAKSALTFN